MKRLLLSLAVLFATGVLTAQTLNDKGLYIDDEGELFSGIISQNQNNIKSEFQVKAGVIEGQANYFYASGKLMESGYFKNGQKDQKWTRYAESGTVIAIGFYKLGKKDGTWLVFDERGNKRFEMTYSDGQKSGVWTSWDESGQELSRADYSRVN